MQSINQVIILCISILKNLRRQLTRTVWPTESEKETAILCCCYRLDFRLYFTLTKLCMCPVQKWSLIWYIIFICWRNREVKPFCRKIHIYILNIYKIYNDIMYILCILSWPPSLQTYFVAFTVLWIKPVQK